MAELFARLKSQAAPRRVEVGAEAKLRARAARLARDGGDDGAMSVWVQDGGRIIWSAGEKTSQLVSDGAILDAWGGVSDA